MELHAPDFVGVACSNCLVLTMPQVLPSNICFNYCNVIMSACISNPFLANLPVLYPMKTSAIFQGVQKINFG